MPMARENLENFINTFGFESETEVEKEKQNMSNKLLKIGVILILCFLLLNFVLVVVAMNRRSESEISSSSPTGNFSAEVDQTHEIDKQFESLKKENGELQKSHGELKEQFELLSKTFEQFKSNISSSRGVLLVTPPPENTYQGNSAPQSRSITSCAVAMEILQSPRSQKQTIYPHGNNKSLEVLCDFESDGGGWTIIQKRSSGPKQEFSQNWNEYKNGFGSLNKNFWLGLDNIRALTKSGDQELRIELEDFEGEAKWVKYSNFSISDAPDFYRLAVGGFYTNSTLEDSLTLTDNGKRFTTKDKDNDKHPSVNCAVDGGGGGWWFSYCSLSNLKGLYFEKGETVPNSQGIYWISWNGQEYSFAKTEMKIRTRK